MKKILSLIITLLFFFNYCSCHWWEQHDLSHLAVVKRPLADMLTQSITTYASGLPSELYSQLPFVCEQPGVFPCVRVFQGLFNEVFTSAGCAREECSGSFPGVIYGIDKNGMPMHVFFLLNEKTVFLSELKDRGLDLNIIPCPTWVEDDSCSPTLILALPWRDPHNHIVFSAGTRFVYRPDGDTSHHYCIEFFDFESLQPRKALVPKEYAFIEKSHSAQESRDLLITVLNKWVDAMDGDIAYVWGGSSVISSLDTHESFECVIDDGHCIEIFTRPQFSDGQVSGLDCSGLVWLARRIASINSPYRNTAMIKQFLKELTPNDILQKGDLLWVQGHVLILGELENNELFEAAGYSSGYGKVHKINVKDRFVDVENVVDLTDRHFNHLSLTFKGMNGSLTYHREFKLLKLL